MADVVTDVIRAYMVLFIFMAAFFIFIGYETTVVGPQRCDQEVASLGYTNPVYTNGGLFSSDHCYGTNQKGDQVIVF